MEESSVTSPAVGGDPMPPCPACGADKLRLEQRLTAKEIGTFSVSGTQMKVSARMRWWLICDGCGIEKEQKD